MRLPLFPTVLAACLAAAQAAAAAAEECPSAQAAGVSPNIQVRPVVASPQYRHDVSRLQLTDMMHKQNNGSRHSTVLGLTISHYDATKWTYRPTTVQRGNTYCHYIKNLEMDLNLASLIVYVASEYRQGTCQAQVILTHENEHVRVHQFVVQKFAPIMRETVAKHARSAFTSNSPDAETAINRLVKPAIVSVLAEMRAEQRRGNGYIDTQDSYRRTAEYCRKW